MKRRAFLWAGWWVGVGLLAGGCARWPAREAPPVSRLADGMAARLEIARDVAWTKAQTGAPVLDGERERVLLAALVKQGGEAGLAEDRVERFFTAQIAASREVQMELLAAWAAGTRERPRTAPLDLRTQIRPRLDAVSTELIASLADGPEDWPAGDRMRIERRLRQCGFSEAVSRLAAGGL